MRFGRKGRPAYVPHEIFHSFQSQVSGVASTSNSVGTSSRDVTTTTTASVFPQLSLSEKENSGTRRRVIYTRRSSAFLVTPPRPPDGVVISIAADRRGNGALIRRIRPQYPRTSLEDRGAVIYRRGLLECCSGAAERGERGFSILTRTGTAFRTRSPWEATPVLKGCYERPDSYRNARQ